MKLRRGTRPTVSWIAEDEFEIDGIEYACRPVSDVFQSTSERFCLRKAPGEVERYARFLGERPTDAIFELGIYDGGSTALIAQLAQPRKLVAVDISKPRSVGLSKWIANRGLEDSVRPLWGVDQSDRPRLAEIVAQEFGGTPLDLVIDDASHLLGPTRDSFEVLFPLLRPGGVFVIEDWAWAHAHQGTWPDVPALTTFIWELVVAAGHSPEVFEELTIDGGWCAVRRGRAPVEAAGFSVAEWFGERGRSLLDGER